MKSIFNWKEATVFDIEADGLLDEATLMHVLSYRLADGRGGSIKGDAEERIRNFFQHHLDNNIPVIAHNGISYDVPLVEKLLGMDLSKLMVIDTLALSWYLNYDRKRHGLDSFHEDYGIEKPEIEDWENLTYEEYKFRCEEDVKINVALWEDLKERLEDMYSLAQKEIDPGNVGGTRAFPEEEIYIDRYKGGSVEDAINRILTFLMFKMDCLRLQEETGWLVDEELLESSIKDIEAKLADAKEQVEKLMPRVPKYSVRKKPAKPFKTNGELSVSGENWKKIVEDYNSKSLDDMGNRLVIKSNKEGELKVLKDYEDPNVGSPQQVKDFLFSKGWKPQTFKYVRDEEAFTAWVESKPKKGANHFEWSDWKERRPEDRAIPQISVDGDEGKELCESLEELAEEVPEILMYTNYNLLKHRLGVLEGFKKNLKGGKLRARASGFTNTLRLKHAEIVNLPGIHRPYGDVVRGVLIAGRGKVSMGSDLSSLEDRSKHHFMLPHDPDYVATMQEEDFDPHILMALTAGLITKEDFNKFKEGIKSPQAVEARRAGKTANYAAVYGSGPPTLARAAGVDLETGKKLHEGYWELNWSVKAISEEQVVIVDKRGGRWLINPINGFCYSLRKDADRFSTLCQGSGAFFFDMWVDEVLTGMEKKWGKRTFTAQFHDEMVIIINNREKFKASLEKIVRDSIDKVSDKFKLRRRLGCDVQFGQRYSEIH